MQATFINCKFVFTIEECLNYIYNAFFKKYITFMHEMIRDSKVF